VSVTLPPCPWTVIRPERAVPEFCCTVYAIAVLVAADGGEIFVIHGTSLVAVHGQPDPAVTATVPSSPLPLAPADVGLIDHWHSVAG